MKPFLTFDQQLEYLENCKNLTILNHDLAKETLQRIGYFGLIGGYKSAFKNPTTGNYRDDVCFEDIVALYSFDERLRELLLRYLLKIERNVRSLLAYYFCEKHGANQSCYLDAGNYSEDPKRKGDVARLIATLNGLANKGSDLSYINHQRKQYSNVPLWVLVNGLTFGSLSKLYLLVKQDIRASVSKNSDDVNERQLGQYMSVLTKFRNVAAHSERLFTYRTKNDIPNTMLHSQLGIPKQGRQYRCGKHDVFSVAIAFKYLLADSEFNSFTCDLAKIIDGYFSSDGALAKEQLLDMLGFPINWRRIIFQPK